MCLSISLADIIRLLYYLQHDEVMMSIIISLKIILITVIRIFSEGCKPDFFKKKENNIETAFSCVSFSFSASPMLLVWPQCFGKHTE